MLPSPDRRTDYPHVTTLLKEAGLVDTAFMSDYARDRGTAVHLATALHHEDDLDEDLLDPAIFPYLTAYRSFLKHCNVSDVRCEVEVLNRELGFCGTTDRLWKINGRPAITDLKCGARSSWHQLQTAGYAGSFLTPLARFALYLRGDGSFLLEEHKNRQDWPTFKAIVLVAQWRKANP